MLDSIEEVNARIHGYGSLNFGRNLRHTYEQLAERDVRPEDLETVMGFAERILECPMETIAGVPETLAYLAARHDLTLFTKGHPDEQTLKIDRSGLREYFRHTAIVKEKDCDAYRRLVAERGMDPARTWMIGNSPKSDINPALAAGLHAVFVPHAHTWVLEKQEIAEADGRLLVVGAIRGFAKTLLRPVSWWTPGRPCDQESWSSAEAGKPVTTEDRRNTLRCRRMRARAITRAAWVIAAQATSNTMPTATSADIWVIPQIEYQGDCWY